MAARWGNDGAGGNDGAAGEWRRGEGMTVGNDSESGLPIFIVMLVTWWDGLGVLTS
jgi:hypothetical protein